MSDLIDRVAVLEDLEKRMADDYVDSARFAEYIRTLPSAEPERSAKVVEHDASVTDTDGYKYHRSEYLCDACKKKVIGGDEYCSHCGCRLDWDEDIPMEYFESGGR